MTRFIAPFGLCVLVVIWAGVTGAAEQNRRPHKPGAGPGPAQVRQPKAHLPGHGDRRAGHDRPDHRRHTHRPGPVHRGATGYRPHPYIYPRYRYPYPYSYPYPYPYQPPYYFNYYWTAPLYIPAEALYGPQAVKRFMGAGQMNRPPLDPQIIARPLPNGEKGAGADNKENINQRAANRRALDLGWRFIGFGDAHFSNQKYTDAYQRYKKAAQAAPGLATAHFRQAYALTAQGRYELAAKALKRGLAIDPGWPRSAFRSDDLYGPNKLAKTAHIDALAKAAADKPDDTDISFLLGVYFYFDGQKDRAAAAFKQALQLAAGDDAHLKGFLKELQ